MAIKVKVPSPGESISQVQIASWLVNSGDYVEKDAEIVEIDSDKATLTVNAEASGTITLLAAAGDTVDVGSVIAEIDTDAVQDTSAPAPKAAEAPAPPAAIAAPAQPKAAPVELPIPQGNLQVNVTPVAREILRQKGISEADLIQAINLIRIGKADVEGLNPGALQTAAPAPVLPASKPGSRDEEREKMSTLRQKLAKRLVGVRNETAMLTTFNEVNMTPLKKLRDSYNKRFQEKYGIKLGYMSLFTKAVTLALEEFPRVNSRIEGEEIVTPRYADIGIAVSAPKGLVVPVLRNAEAMSLAQIELKIKELADKARSNKISLEEMSGGTFTITNGGVFGSMLSTPILNPPQSAILGMHNIVDRPLAVDGRVEIHPVMYIALSYDHRVIDGRESVGFLFRIKEILESPERMLSAGKDPMELLLGL